ncbi:hypothetical protein LCGC14_1805740 [marine sediment metagenome]|uniref:Uncharacterized protein n=1 Tax=marine sediment metagenome TaxID=412755 RepID=A0A0F9GNE8_9ZZZZ
MKRSAICKWSIILLHKHPRWIQLRAFFRKTGIWKANWDGGIIYWWFEKANLTLPVDYERRLFQQGLIEGLLTSRSD